VKTKTGKVRTAPKGSLTEEFFNGISALLSLLHSAANGRNGSQFTGFSRGKKRPESGDVRTPALVAKAAEKPAQLQTRARQHITPGGKKAAPHRQEPM